ncbi:MAG: hypothetical protein ACFFDF_11515 [Candidatus Odinarchaeota archaeon]
MLQNEELLKKRFFLEHLYIRKLGIPGKLFPMLITVIFLIVGYFAGIFEAEIEIMAQISYIFWILFIPLTIYLMTWLDKSMKRTIRKANQLIIYEKETQRNILNSLYGTPGILMSLLIALPFILYDITGFWFTGEGWLTDIQAYFLASDNSWYPHITETMNGIGFGSLLWLIVWIIPWLFMGALIWMSISFVIYIRSILKETKWKDDIKKVIREKQHRGILTSSIMAFLPLSPFIAIKFIYQAFFEPWWSDTVSMYILFILFIIGTIVSPSIIAGDIDKEKKETLQNMAKLEASQFENLLQGKQINTESILRATLIYLYIEKVNTEFKKKTLDKHLVNRMIVAALVPVITYAVRYLIPILG